ncbi:hypothetical protein MMC22_006042 [Lobaria immixta]|nr:hypothetical protein [Lobaria immixta]
MTNVSPTSGESNSETSKKRDVAVRSRHQPSTRQGSTPTIPAKREIVDLTTEDEDSLLSPRRKRPDTIQYFSKDDEDTSTDSQEAIKTPGKSNTRGRRLDATVRTTPNTPVPVSDDELGSERKFPKSKALFKKSLALKPQASKSRISEPLRSTAKKLKSNTPASAQNSAQIAIPVAQPSAKDLRDLRDQFLNNLKRLKGPQVKLVNEIDDSSPPVSFTFVNVSIICDGVETVDEGFMSGCGCRPENGRNCGCEYRYCLCLRLSAKDENGDHHFPYSASTVKRGCLRPFYLNSRHHIYECNRCCNCRDNCKNKVVQHGRQVQLEIFKTENRGWGLRCPEDLQKGQFIDTYRGEIITNDEAERREKSRTVDQNNYFMNFDKHTPDRMMTAKELKVALPEDEYLAVERQVQQGRYETEIFEDDDGQETEHWLNPRYKTPYVCDGMTHGGPSKFMNHSCDPNCRIFTVSYNHADENIYDIAFFAAEPIPAGTELTFDYKDEDDREIITDEQANAIHAKYGYQPTRCMCGSKDCRGYFFN